MARSGSRGLERAVLATGVLLLAGIALFAGYYYWDRYVRPVRAHKTAIPAEIAQLEKNIEANPDKPDLRAELAGYYLAHEQYREALGVAEQVLGAYPNNEPALLIGGEASLRLGQAQDAAGRLRHFVDARKDLPMAKTDQGLEEADYFLGEAYVSLNQPADAVTALEDALAISPTDADALYQAGLAYQMLGETEKAQARLEKAVRLVSDFGEAFAALAQLYTSQNKSDYAAYARAMQAYASNDYASALAQLQTVTQALPNYAPAFLGLGLAYEGLGQLDQAQVAVERALQIDGGDLAARQAQGRIASAMQEKQ